MVKGSGGHLKAVWLTMRWEECPGQKPSLLAGDTISAMFVILRT
jgi:hypothetical protein